MPLKQELWLAGLREGQAMRFRPQGGSMAPFLRPGDVVTIAPGTECRAGDIVLWQMDEALVLHRVVAKRNGRIITKGDSLGGLDASVTREQVLGRAVARERQGRVRRLGRLGARFLGLAFSFTVALLPGLIPMLARVKASIGKPSAGLSANKAMD